MLDISNCAITSLHPGLFQKLPSLQVLDISDNYLLHLDVEVITTLPNLNTLMVNDNNFDCKDVRMDRLRDYTRTEGIGYEDPCLKDKKKKKTGQQFERMMAIGPKVPEKNVWIYDDEEEGLKNVKVVEICGGNQNRSAEFEGGVDNMLMEIIRMSPIISILIVVVFGIFLGISL